MKISDFLVKDAVKLNLNSTDKVSTIKELVDILINSKVVKPEFKDELIDSVLKREALGSTGIGQNIGIPHGRVEGIDRIIAALGISKEGIDFEALDGEPVYIFFLLVSPVDLVGPHLKALARISKLLRDKHFRMLLRKASSNAEVLKIINEEDDKRQ